MYMGLYRNKNISLVDAPLQYFLNVYWGLSNACKINDIVSVKFQRNLSGPYSTISRS